MVTFPTEDHNNKGMKDIFFGEKVGRMHSATYRGHGYIPLRFGEGGGGGEGGGRGWNVVRRMGTQQQIL